MTDELKVALIRVDQITFHKHNTRVDLGDLRSLSDSISLYGVMQPIVVEQRGMTFRLRAGHRRVAAARMAGVARVPAVIHTEALDDQRWIEQSVHENTQRRELDHRDRKRCVQALRNLGCTWEGVASTFGVTVNTVRSWLTGESETKPRERHAAVGRGPTARTRAVQALIDSHKDEYDRILERELEAEVDWVVVQRAMDRQPVVATKAERHVIIQRWKRDGRPLNELGRIQAWNVRRDLRESAA